MNRGSAALCAASAYASLNAQLALGFAGSLPGLSWSGIEGLLLEVGLWATAVTAAKESASRRARRREEDIGIGFPPREYGSGSTQCFPH